MDLIAPTRLPNGSSVWLDSEVRDFIRRLHDLDPRLALVKNGDGSWSIWRVGEDGSEHHIARSSPGAKLDQAVIEHLRQRDLTRRGTNPIEQMIANNLKREQEIEQHAEEALEEAMEKVISKSWRGHIPTNVEDISVL